MIGLAFYLIITQLCLINFLLNKYNDVCRQQATISSLLVSYSEEFTEFVKHGVDFNKNVSTVVTTHKECIVELQHKIKQAEELLKTSQEDIMAIHNRCVKKGI